MAAFSSVLKHILNPPVQPSRLIVNHRVRLFAALGAGTVATVVFLTGYYLTLGLLPSAFAYPQTDYPVASWAHRMDLAQFLGSFIYPPLPSPTTWWIGIIALGGLLASQGLVYAVLLSWTLQWSDTVKGVGFGIGFFINLGLTLTIANGMQPAIMRNAFPDTGLFLIGWSSWATLQLLVLCVAYGGIMGALYEKWTVKK